MRLADGLDADHFQVVEAATVVDRGDHLRLELRAHDAPDLDMWAAERNGDLFERSSAATSSRSRSRSPSRSWPLAVPEPG